MFLKKIVKKALNQTWSKDDRVGYITDQTSDGQSSIVSRLIFDIFGGEILKTHFKNSWHFYNRIDGESIDFSLTESNKVTSAISFEDIPSTPDEIGSYYPEEDYSNFFFRFIRVFEEVVGLKRRRFRIAA
jgi:hypothetical protein